MPAKDVLPYLDEAVTSILSQSYRDFEFVILDDGSRDGTRERLQYWASADRRIRLIEGDRSLGPVGSSNLVVEAARAPIVARMDADDVSSPDRLERQLGLLEGRRDAVLVGSVWEGIDRRGEVVREPDLSRLGTSGFAAPFAHGSIMFRRQAFLRAGGYRPECAYWEDLDLYLRMAAQGRVLVTSTPLYRHRFSETSTRLTSRPARVEEAVDLMFRCRAVFERGDDYARLLDALPADQGSRRLHPYTFLSIAFISLWSGLRPHALQGLLRRGALRPDLISLKALLWAAWAELSPGSLRWLMQIVLRARNGSRARVIAAAPVTEWRPAPGSGETAFSDCAGTFSSSSGGRAPSASTRFASVPAGYRDS